MREYGVGITSWEDLPKSDAIIAAVAHRQFQQLSAEAICDKLTEGGCFIDVKAAFDASRLSACGINVWRL